MATKETYTLRALNEFIHRIIALNFSSAVWVTAEINQVSGSRGHYYITLIQKDTTSGIVAQSQAVLWSNTALRLQSKYKTPAASLLQEGMEIRLRVKPHFHERYGYKLVIEEIDLSFTLGNLEQKRQAILEQLQVEGLIRKNRQCPLPIISPRIAVISAKTAAGFVDFQKQLLNNPYGYHYQISLFESAMQGVAVEKEILAALKSIRNLKSRFDLVVIIRGGGAKIDLANFDNYEIAKMAANFPLPILTGIGHEIDQSLLDLVVHTTLKTPTAVAQFLIEYHLNRESDILNTAQQIQSITQNVIEQKKFELRHIRQAILLQVNSKIRKTKDLLDTQAVTLPYFVNKILTNAHKDLNTSLTLHRLLDKDQILKRGYSLTLKDGAIIKSTNQIKKGVQITTLLQDGAIKSVVEDKK